MWDIEIGKATQIEFPTAEQLETAACYPLIVPPKTPR